MDAAPAMTDSMASCLDPFRLVERFDGHCDRPAEVAVLLNDAKAACDPTVRLREPTWSGRWNCSASTRRAPAVHPPVLKVCSRPGRFPSPGVHRGAPGFVDPGCGPCGACRSQRESLLQGPSSRAWPGANGLCLPPTGTAGATADADDGGLDVPDLAGPRNVRPGAPEPGVVPAARRRQSHGMAPATCRRAPPRPAVSRHASP